MPLFVTVGLVLRVLLLLLLQMKRSTVVAANGSSVLDDYRTSYGTFIK
jgi:prolyl 4-hydroxylase